MRLGRRPLGLMMTWNVPTPRGLPESLPGFGRESETRDSSAPAPAPALRNPSPQPHRPFSIAAPGSPSWTLARTSTLRIQLQAFGLRHELNIITANSRVL